MRTERKQAIKNGTAKAVSSILGDAHLIFQSLADGCMNLEGHLVHKLTDRDYDEIRQDRWNSTRRKQQDVKNIIAKAKASFNANLYREHADQMDAITNLGEQ